MLDYIPPPSRLPPGSIVWAYLRDSGGDAQEQSVPQQRAEIESYCQRHGLVLGHVFADVARSGGSVIGRDAFHDLMDMSGHDEYRPAGLLLWNHARFARDLDDSSYYKALLRKRGLVVHSLTDPIPEGIYGRVVETIIDIANEEKRRQTSRDVKRALRALFQQGFSFGVPPRGYLAQPVEIGKKRDGRPRIVSRWIPDPDLWEAVQLAWQLRAEGKTYSEIREATYGRVYKSKNCWPTFFANIAYTGIGRWGDLEVADHHPPAIDFATWEAVQRMQAEIKRPRAGSLYHPRRVGTPSLLSGLAFCIHCGSAMLKDRTGTNDWDCYICGRKRRQGWKSCEGRMVNAHKADAVILDTVLDRVLTPEYISELLNETRSQLTDMASIDTDVERILRDLAKTDRAISNLLDLAENDGATSARERLRQREGERARLRYDLQQTEAKRQAAQVEITPEALALVLDAWRQRIYQEHQAGDLRGLKSVLTRFVNKIELGHNIARIWYSFPINALYNGFGVPQAGGTKIRLVKRILVFKRIIT